MIAAIEGVVSHKDINKIILKTNSGVSYNIFVSLFSLAKIDLHSKIELFTSMIIKEDMQRLYGFINKKEQKMFEMLLKVNGIGANTAMNICSSMDENSFQKALHLKDENKFKQISGIGAKVAKRIIIELSDLKTDALLNSQNANSSSAFEALINFGFKKENIIKVLNELNINDPTELVKEALKRLKGAK